MTINLAKKLTNLKNEVHIPRCGICNMVERMDAETKTAFVEVMDSSVTLQAITLALNSEGFKVSRFQLGEARRNCLKGEKDCKIFNHCKISKGTSK